MELELLKPGSGVSRVCPLGVFFVELVGWASGCVGLGGSWEGLWYKPRSAVFCAWLGVAWWEKVICS